MDSLWDKRFLDLARYVAQWSKDPSTQTGAVIVDPFRRVLSLGFNGFPRGVIDSPERLNDREIKYKMIVHCERNAIVYARTSVVGATLYTWPFASCSPCAGMVIQAGITRCVAPTPSDDILSRWRNDLEITGQMYKEAGVMLDILD